jgi:hypothetical protein
LVKITIKDCDPTDIRSALSVLDRFKRALTFILLAFGKEALTTFPLYFITNCKRINATRKITTIAIFSIGIITPNSLSGVLHTAYQSIFYIYLQ